MILEISLPLLICFFIGERLRFGSSSDELSHLNKPWTSGGREKLLLFSFESSIGLLWELASKCAFWLFSTID